MSKQIPMGTTSVSLSMDRWVNKHGRFRYEIRILCVDYPYSGYDGLRDRIPTINEVKTAVDWIIAKEHQIRMADYSDSQLKLLHNEICNIIAELVG